MQWRQRQRLTAGPDFSSHDTLVGWIQMAKPTVSEVVDAADNDPDKAEAPLAAEKEATGGQPRKGVKQGLEDVLEEDLDEEEQ